MYTMLFHSLALANLASAGLLRRDETTKPDGLSVTYMNTPRSYSTNAKQPKPDPGKCPTGHVPSRYYGISLNINMNRIGDIPSYGRSPTELNKLASYTVKASQIIFDPGAAVGVDVNSVACQAFKDADGVQPLGEEFTAKEALELAGPGQELVQVGAILCYVSGDEMYDDDEDEEEKKE